MTTAGFEKALNDLVIEQRSHTGMKLKIHMGMQPYSFTSVNKTYINDDTFYISAGDCSLWGSISKVTAMFTSFE